MLHKTLEAKATVTELGEFEALAAAYTVDRVKDQIIFGAFAKTIDAWQQSGKQIPLHWNHSGDAKDIIGSVDPASMTEVQDEGLRVKGKVDLDGSEVAKEAWRSMKANALALSFGYIATKTKQRAGVLELLEIDLFEVSIVPAPANPDTHFINLKAVPQEALPDAVVEACGRLNELAEEAKVDLLRKAQEALGVKQVDETDKEPSARSVDPLREQADKVALEFASDGVDLPESPKKVEPPKPELPLRELKQRSRDEMLTLLSGETV